MLAGLFYSRVNKCDDRGSVFQDSGSHRILEEVGVSPPSNSSTEQPAGRRTKQNVDETNVSPRFEVASPDKFISSADIFRNPGGKMMEDSRDSKNGRLFGGLSSKDSFSKISATALGYIVRKRMQSNTAMKLKKYIIDSEYDNEKRSYCVKHLIEYVETGILSLSYDDNVILSYPDALNVIVTEKNVSIEVCEESPTEHLSSAVDIESYSSVKSRVIAENIVTSLRETLGMQNEPLINLLSDVTPDFLTERRRVFLQTIFSLEERECIFPKVPRMIPGDMRRFLRHPVSKSASRRFFVSLPWESSIPSWEDNRWEDIGRSIVKQAIASDTGRVAFEECAIARQQLEEVVQGAGYDANVFVFGGLVVLGLLEVGGDVDFVGVADVEPGVEESGEIVSRLSREMRRLGLRSSALPKARVPVIKVDRVSKTLPGTPLHHLGACGLFQFARQLNDVESSSFKARLQENYGALNVDWNNTQQFATVEFKDTTSLIVALTQVKTHETIDIPLRLPVEPRNGPELYRLPFDFCFSSIGLRNSYLLSGALSQYPFSRHLLLLIKKWGRASGIVNSIDGFLASYALTVMCAHFLIKVGILPKISTLRGADEPQLLPHFPEYRPLHDGCGYNLGDVGFLAAAFFEYYGKIFDYENSVVCTTNMNLSKKTLRWEKSPGLSTGRPPYFEFAIKDPYGLDNIGRNLDKEAVEYVRSAHGLALSAFLKEKHDPDFVINMLTHSPPRPPRKTRSLASRGIGSSNFSHDQLEARHILKKMEFHERRKAMERFGQRTIENTEQQRVMSNVTKDVLGWIRSDDH